jgi:hypothetical protein
VLPTAVRAWPPKRLVALEIVGVTWLSHLPQVPCGLGLLFLVSSMRVGDKSLNVCTVHFQQSSSPRTVTRDHSEWARGAVYHLMASAHALGFPQILQ